MLCSDRCFVFCWILVETRREYIAVSETGEGGIVLEEPTGRPSFSFLLGLLGLLGAEEKMKKLKKVLVVFGGFRYIFGRWRGSRKLDRIS